MNMAFFSPRNLLVIAAFTLLFHIAFNPIYVAVGGTSADA